MALTYITKAAEMQANRNKIIAGQIAQMTKNLAAKQAVKDARSQKIVDEARTYSNDFYKAYQTQEKSGTVAWNSGASEMVSNLASNQEQMYREAFGDGGTPELKNKFRMQQTQDQQTLKTIGSWAKLNNDASNSLIQNQAAYEQDIDMGRFTRGNDNNKLSIHQNMQNGAYSNYKFDFDESGNVVLNASAYDKDGNPTKDDFRNITADVANNSAGNSFYDQIEEDDLLPKVLGDRWNDQKNGYGTLFKPKRVTKSVYDPASDTDTTYVEDVYNPKAIKQDLMGVYSDRLETEIRGPGFDKTWDQLYRGGYIRNNQGHLEEGNIAWSTVQKVKTMDLIQFGEEIGDVDGKEGITDEDKNMWLNNMDKAAKEGLSNYYSEMMAPQKNTIISKKVDDNGDDKEIDPVTGKPVVAKKGPSQMNQAQIIQAEKNKPIFKAIETAEISPIKENDPESEAARSTEIASLMSNNNAGQSDGTPLKFMTGSELKKTSPEEYASLDDNAIYRIDRKNNKAYAPGKVNSNGEAEPKTYNNPVPVLGADIVGMQDEKDLRRRIMRVSGVDASEYTYLNSQYESQNSKNKPTNYVVKGKYNTKADADEAKKPGERVIKNPSTGKFEVIK